LAKLLVKCCRRLIRAWYEAESGKIGTPTDRRELVRVIALRFPIILRRYTPSPLADYMDLQAFETRISMLVKRRSLFRPMTNSLRQTPSQTLPIGTIGSWKPPSASFANATLFTR
jgi:hypothetical protein